MSSYLSAVLSALRPVYRFAGQQAAPLEIETSLPVQLVHDVAPQAQGFNQIRAKTVAPLVIAAGGTTGFAEVSALGLLNAGLAAAFNPYRLQYVLQDVDIWLVRFSALADAAANVSTAAIALFDDACEGEILVEYNSTGGSAINAGRIMLLATNRPLPILLPQLVNNTGGIRFRGVSGAGGAVTYFFSVDYVIVPRGVPLQR